MVLKSSLGRIVDVNLGILCSLFNSRVLAVAVIGGSYTCFAFPNFSGRFKEIFVDIFDYLLSILVINGMAVFAIRTLVGRSIAATR